MAQTEQRIRSRRLSSDQTAALGLKANAQKAIVISASGWCASRYEYAWATSSVLAAANASRLGRAYNPTSAQMPVTTATSQTAWRNIGSGRTPHPKGRSKTLRAGMGRYWFAA